MPTAANTIPAPITTPTTIPASAPGGRYPFRVGDGRRVPTVDPLVGVPDDGGDVKFPGAGAETALTDGGGAGGEKVELVSGGAGSDVSGGCEVITGDDTVTFDTLSKIFLSFLV